MGGAFQPIFTASVKWRKLFSDSAGVRTWRSSTFSRLIGVSVTRSLTCDPAVCHLWDPPGHRRKTCFISTVITVMCSTYRWTVTTQRSVCVHFLPLYLVFNTAKWVMLGWYTPRECSLKCTSSHGFHVQTQAWSGVFPDLVKKKDNNNNNNNSAISLVVLLFLLRSTFKVYWTSCFDLCLF